MRGSVASALAFADVPAEAGLEWALRLGRGGTIARIGVAGLRGRGGAGFPVDSKWGLCAAARGDRKLVVCNANEGEPGRFKDRAIISRFANLVFEGLTIAGFACGAREGVVYLRAEYAHLLAHLEAVLAARRQRGLLGEAVRGHAGFDFDVRIRLGAGSYLCGEETALIESLEGHRGEPRSRPPFPVNTGFLGLPTVVNNVETLARAAAILASGEARRKGAADAPPVGGLELVSVSGDCDRPGIHELPHKTTVSELLAAVGGAGAKGVLLGGASGEVLPPGEFGRAIAGPEQPGSGAVVVLGPNRSMLDVAANLVEFFAFESCGQCTP
ncbi:MAG TPA: SLBB domain-containing protein, partial [Polyangia bacterium]|nr:SLBB domain-containing protein [Polyangia bacterium]